MTNISANMHSTGMPLNIKLRAPKIELHFPNPFPIIIPEMAYNFFLTQEGRNIPMYLTSYVNDVL